MPLIKLHQPNWKKVDDANREEFYIEQSSIQAIRFGYHIQSDETKLPVLIITLASGEVVQATESLTEILEQMS